MGKKRKEEESGHESSPKSVQVFRCRLEFPTTHTTGTECRRRRLGLVVATGSQWHARFLECEKKRRRNAHSNQLIPKICHRLMTPTRSGRRKEINTRGHSLWKKELLLLPGGYRTRGKRKEKKTGRHTETKEHQDRRNAPYTTRKKGPTKSFFSTIFDSMRRGSRRSVHGWDSGVYTEEGSKQHEAREIESVQLTFLLECITRFLTLALSLSPPRAREAHRSRGLQAPR